MKSKFHGIFIIILLLFFHFDLLLGQPQVKKVFPGWTSYTNSNYIKDLVLDKNILWAAAGGVIKYNLAKGTRVKYLKEHGIASNNVLKIVPHEDTLWMATANGITCFHMKKNTWKSFYKADGLPDDAVTAAVVDTANNRIWFGSWEGFLFSFNTIKKKWNFYKSKISIPDTIISSLAVDPATGLLLVGTWGKGLYLYKPGSQLPVKQKFAPLQSIDFISAILAEDKTLWIGTVNNGLWVTDLRTIGHDAEPPNEKFLRGAKRGKMGRWEVKKVNKNYKLQITNYNVQNYKPNGINASMQYHSNSPLFPSFLSSQLPIFPLYPPGRRGQNIFITGIKASPGKDKVFITTNGSGLLVYYKKTGKWETITTKQGIPTDQLKVSAGDGENIFLGSDGQGIVQLNLKTGNIHRFDFSNEIANNKVSVVTPDPRNNRLWIGTEGNGAAGFDIAAEKWTILNTSNRVLSSDVVNCIAVDGLHDNVWIGTDNGMVRYESRTGDYQRYGFDEGLDSVMVYAAGFDHINRLWAGFYIGSPAIFNPIAKRWKTIEEAPGDVCYGLSMDNKTKSVWMATAGGIINYDIKTGKSTNYWKGIEFRSLLFDAEKREVWAGSWGEGLYRLTVETHQQKKIKRFESLSVLDIKKDEVKNTTWFATNAGAFYYDTEKQTFTHLDVTNGLGLNFVLSIAITRDSIWFGTWDGGLSRLQKDFCLRRPGGTLFEKTAPPGPPRKNFYLGDL
jgi:ligand-binding sensor domain-containing protein